MTVATQETTFTPQPGPQTQGTTSEADILIMGGAAGSGIGGEPIPVQILIPENHR